MEKQILREEIVETQVKVEELVEEMDNLRVELDKSQADCSKVYINLLIFFVPFFFLNLMISGGYLTREPDIKTSEILLMGKIH